MSVNPLKPDRVSADSPLHGLPAARISKEPAAMPLPSRKNPLKFGRRASDNEAETKRMPRAAQTARQPLAATDPDQLAQINRLPPSARLIPAAEFSGGTMRLRLPMLIDGGNARLLRKRVLSGLPHCQAMELDADRLQWIGELGCAYVWQVLSIAQKNGVDVALVNVSQRIHEALERAMANDSSRLMACGGSATVRLEDCESELRLTGKTLRLRTGIEPEAERPANGGEGGRIAPAEEAVESTAEPKREKSGWTRRLTLWLLNRRKAA